MDSGWDTLAGGFPHSEISGSMRICPLPGAFRRLSRLSSPVVAKASTVCACSLDPITRTPVVGCHLTLENPCRGCGRALRDISDFPRALTRTLHFAPSTLLKNSRAWNPVPGTVGPSRYPTPSHCTEPVKTTHSNHKSGAHRRWSWISVRGRAGWWSQAGSNRRPPACKAGALPAELWPHGLVGLGGLEPPTSPLSGVRSNRLSYRPALGFRLLGRGFAPRALGKGGDPAAGSPTATLLRLHPSH